MKGSVTMGWVDLLCFAPLLLAVAFAVTVVRCEMKLRRTAKGKTMNKISTSVLTMPKGTTSQAFLLVPADWWDEETGMLRVPPAEAACDIETPDFSCCEECEIEVRPVPDERDQMAGPVPSREFLLLLGLTERLCRYVNICGHNLTETELATLKRARALAIDTKGEPGE